MALPQMTIDKLMETLGYKDVGQNKNNQFGKTYKKILTDEGKFSIRGHNKKVYLVIVEFNSEEDFNKFNPSDFRGKVEKLGQGCEFFANDEGEDGKKNVIFKISIYTFIK